MNKNQDVGLLILRVTLGILILLHGIHKILHGVGGIEAAFQGIGLPGFLAYTVYIGEVLAPLLLIVGFYSRIGAGLIAVTMVVAIGLAHNHEIFDLTQNGGWALELQGMFLFTAVALALTGPGKYALDKS